MIFICCFISIVVASLTFNFIKIPEVTPTRASTALSLIFFLIQYVLSEVYAFDLHYFAFLIFGASFVGMCSHKIFNDLQVVLAAVLFSVLFSVVTPHYYEIGGALGFSAFVSVFTVYLVSRKIIYDF